MVDFALILRRSAEVKSALASDTSFLANWRKAGEALQRTVTAGGTVFACGNGGSACDAMHLTEELIARYRGDRPGIKAMHWLDAGTMTCWGNDKDFRGVFGRYADTFCSPIDTVVAISTSGNSQNVIEGVVAAKAKGATVIGLLGKDGGKLKALVDIPVIVSAVETERIQEAHITAIHGWCELFERQ